MIARGHGLDDARDAWRIEAGEQDRGFDLCRCDRQAIVERHGRAGAPHGERQPLARAGREARAHAAQWLRYPSHGPLAQAGVAREGGGQLMACQQAHQQAGRRAAIAHVQRSLRLEQTADAHAMNMPDALGVAIDLRAHRPHRGRGGEHILALQQAFHPAFPHRQRRQHQRSVGNALVAGHGDAARQRRRSAEGRGGGLIIRLGHGCPLSWNRKNAWGF